MELIEKIDADLVSSARAVEYVRSLQGLHHHSFHSLREAWVATSEERLVVFVGRPETESSRRGHRILAAVELDEAGHVATLIKLVSDFSGDPREFANHIVDCVDRFRKGDRFDG